MATQIDLSRQAKDLSLTTSKIASQAITNEKIQDGSIDNSKIATNAAIVYSKLSIVDGDIVISKLNTTSADFDSTGQLKTGVVGDPEVSALSISKITELSTELSSFLKLDGTRAMTGILDMGGYKISNLGAGSLSSDAITKSQLDSAISGVQSTIQKFTWLNAVIDATNTPPLSPSQGDRYLVTATASGAWAGHENDIAEWDGTQWVFTLHSSLSAGTFISVNTLNDRLDMWDGTNWVYKYFESTTASTGLTKVGFDIRLDSSAAGSGLLFSSGVLSVDVGTTANKILKLDSAAKIPAVDGSQLLNVNADKLDSLDSTDFLRATASSSVSSGNTLTIASGATFSIASGATWNLGGTAITATAAQLNSLGTIVTRETPSGTIDGSNKVFTLANTPISGSESVFLNGILQNAGVSNDYTISGNTITFATAPSVGDVILVNYRY